MELSIHAVDVCAVQRFKFSKNSERLLALLNNNRVGATILPLGVMLGDSTLKDCARLDGQLGGGPFPLVDLRSDAIVRGFDSEPSPVACTHTQGRR